MNRFRYLVAVTTVVVAAFPCSGALADAVEIHHPWARATAPSAANGAAFMRIYNTTETADRVVAASANVSKTVELHTHIMDGDIMRMREVEAIDVPAGGAADLEPGGLHIMFLGLDAPLKEGETFPLTLTFENAGDVTVDVAISGPGAMAPKHGDHHGEGHDSSDHHEDHDAMHKKSY
jgi:copper(I)-binding protein